MKRKHPKFGKQWTVNDRGDGRTVSVMLGQHGRVLSREEAMELARALMDVGVTQLEDEVEKIVTEAREADELKTVRERVRTHDAVDDELLK